MRTGRGPAGGGLFLTFPEDARWNAERPAVEFGVEIGEYRGVVRVPRRVFQRLLPGGHTRAVRRSLPTAADPLRARCRARGSSPVVGPEWKLEIRGATRCRMSAGSPYTR